MNTHCFPQRSNSSINDYADQWSIDRVQSAWNEKIPSHLNPIGGPDWIGWVSLCRDESDPAGEFYGEYWDPTVKYKGLFRFYHPNGKTIPDNLFEDFYLSSYSDGEGISVFPINEGTPPVEYFYFQIADLSKLQRRP